MDVWEYIASVEKEENSKTSKVDSAPKEISCDDVDDEKKDRSEYPKTLMGLLEFSLEQEERVEIIYKEGFDSHSSRAIKVTDIDGDEVWCTNHLDETKCLSLKAMKQYVMGRDQADYYRDDTRDFDDMIYTLEGELTHPDIGDGTYKLYRKDPFFYVRYWSDDVITIELDFEREIYIFETIYTATKEVKSADQILKLILSTLKKHYKTTF